MAIQIRSFPFCCTAKVLCNFGETRTSEGGSHSVEYERIKYEVARLMRSHLTVGYGTDAILTAITNNEQKVANKVLRELGWKSTKFVSKQAHPDTKVKLWYYYV